MDAYQRLEKRLTICEAQGVTLIRFLDRQLVWGVDLDVLWQDLFPVIEARNWNRLVLDFSSVNFLASAALGKLVALRKKVTAKHGMLKLCCLCPDVLEVFTVTKLDGLFEIEQTEADALAALAKG
jgi:anti-sigma B factor antagonist